MKTDRTWIPLTLIAALGLCYGIHVRLADAREASVCSASSAGSETDFVTKYHVADLSTMIPINHPLTSWAGTPERRLEPVPNVVSRPLP